MALLDDESEKYLQDCLKKNQEPDRAELSGLTREDILNFFYEKDIYNYENDCWVTEFKEDFFKGKKLDFDLINSSNGKIVAKVGDKITQRNLNLFKEQDLKSILVDNEHIIGKFIAEDLINESTGEVYAEAGDEITEDLIQLVKLHDLKSISILFIDKSVGPWIRNTLAVDKKCF